MNKYVKKSLKILLWSIASIIGVFLLLVVLVQVPAVQQVLKNKAVSYLEGKIHTPVRIDKIEIGLPKKIILEGVYFQSQQGDTLLSGEKIAVDISLFKLLNNEVEINSVDLQGIVAKVTRNQDSIFNFDYILKTFASDQPKDSIGSMSFSIEKINLDRIQVHFEDAVTKNNLTVSLHHFSTKVKKFDLENTDFEIPKMKMDGLKMRLKQGALIEEISEKTLKIADSLSKRPDLKLRLGEIDFTRIDIGYANAGTKLNSEIALEKLWIRFEQTDIKNQLIAIDQLQLVDLKGRLFLGKLETITTASPSETAIENQWKVTLNQVDFTRINFRFDDTNALPLQKGMDYKHLNLQNLNLKAEKLQYSSQLIAGTIHSLSVREKSGLVIESLKTEFYYGNRKTYLKNLLLKTPQTLLQDEIILKYPSIAALNTNLGELDLNASLKNSRIGFKDILLFAPDLEKNNPFQDNPNAILFLNGGVIGKLNNLAIPNLEISGIGTTRLAASGKITGLPEVKTAYFDLNVRDFSSSSKDILSFVPKGTVPNTIQLPSQVALKGTFKGIAANFDTNLTLTSSFGNAKIKGNLDSRIKNVEKYKAEAELDNFDLGKFIKSDSLGKISLKVKVNGTGFNPKTANAELTGTVSKADFNHYNYQNLGINGVLKKGKFEVNSKMNDPNLTFDLVSNGTFKDKYPSIKLKLNVDIADLEKLNLHAGALKLRGKVDADIATADPDFMNGKISAHHFVVANEQGQFILDSIQVAATASETRNTLSVQSQFLKAEIEGKYQLTQIAAALSNSFAQYYNIKPSAKKPVLQTQQFAFTVTVDNDPVLLKLIPQLKRMEPVTFNGRYNTFNDSIVINALIPRLVYGSNTISGGILKIDTSNKMLVYNLNVDEIENSQFLLPNTNLNGEIKDNTVTYTLQVKDKKDQQHYLVSGNLKAANGTTEVKLNPDGLILNYENWAIDPENSIRFGKNGIYANAFEMQNNGSKIQLQSQTNTPNAPLALDFVAFKIETITRMVQKENLVMGGTINGNVLLKNLNTKAVFTSDLDIENFSFQKDTVGNISIQVDNQVVNTYNARIAITGNGNQVNLDGIYRNDNSSFNLNLNMQQLQLKSIQGFTFGNIDKSSGFLSGKFKVTGTSDQPRINGELKFNNGAFIVTSLNSAYQLLNDKITFNNQGLVFDRFSLADADNNTLTVNGKVNTSNYIDYGFDLRVRADNFQAINSTAKDNDLYYGTLFLDTRLTIKGDLNKPIVEGTIKINEDTQLTIVLPQSDPSLADREGIVEFIDQDNPQLTERLIIATDSISQTQFRGMDVSVNIEIDKEAELTMIIDKSNGDFLKLKGEAQLNGGIDPSGKTTLTGRYELQEGSYEMSFNFIRRKFDIREGSYILWTGEPTSADINIIAVYRTETAPINLLGDQLGTLSPTVRNTYKQKIPFETLLKMRGELLQPEITFDIVLPEGNYNVSSDIVNSSRAKLAQLRQEPAELNKQVFALLLLNRFIGENPFSSESGSGSAESLARQSVSKILSQQLNDLAGNLIDGVELNFDLESSDDYTTGQRENRTDLSVGISKQLLNDQLKVTVGSSFGLEGPQQVNRETNTIAGDVAVDYQLSKDGRYVLRAYRKNEYQVALQGQVVETGLAFIITMDYNKFSELFHRSQEDKKIRRKEMEKKKLRKEQLKKD